MARISSFTITLGIILVVYTIIGGNIVGMYEGTGTIRPYAGKVLNVDYLDNFVEYEYQNVSFNNGAYENTYFTLSPDRAVMWRDAWFEEDYFNIESKGLEWYSTYTKLEPKKVYESVLITNFNYEKNYSRQVFNLGGKLETTMLVYPLFYTDSENITFIYDNLEDSFNSDEVTVLLGSNSTYPSYDVFNFMGIVTGFVGYGIMPLEISILIGGLWWVMFLLMLIKLFVG